MEVYAAMVESVDQSVGRLRAALDELGEWENTVFLFASDNGASREGRNAGGASYFYKSPGTLPGNRDIRDHDRESYDVLGGPTTWPHYPRGWAMACNTPFRLYKVTAFRGGNQVPLVLSWPAEIKSAGEIRHQYQHVTDVLPTLVELLRLELPTERNGLPARPLAGTSFVPTVTDPETPSTHGEQYLECAGHRAFYRNGWEAVTFREPLKPFRDEHWHLFDIANDPTQIRDLADETLSSSPSSWMPGSRPPGQTRCSRWTRAHAFNISGDHRRSGRWAIRSPSGRGTPTLERVRSLRLIADRSFQIVVDWQYRPGDEGIVVAHGGQESGYVVYVEDGCLRFLENTAGEIVALPDRPAWNPEPTSRRGCVPSGDETWRVEIAVDGATATSGTVPQLVGFLPFEGIDIGLDRRSPVSWDLFRRRRTFPFTGTIDSVTYIPGRPAPEAGDAAIEKAIEVGLRLD